MSPRIGAVLVFLVACHLTDAGGDTDPLTIILPEGVSSQADLPACSPNQVCSEVRPYLPQWLPEVRSSKLRDASAMPRNATMFCKCPDEDGSNRCPTSFRFDAVTGQIYNGAKLHTCKPLPFCPLSTSGGVLKKMPAPGGATGAAMAKIEMSCRCPASTDAVFSIPSLDLISAEPEAATVDITCEQVQDTCGISGKAKLCMNVDYKQRGESEIVLGDFSRICSCANGYTCMQPDNQWYRTLSAARTSLRRRGIPYAVKYLERRKGLPICVQGILENEVNYFNEGVTSDDELPECSHSNQVCNVVEPVAKQLGKAMIKIITKYCRCTGHKSCSESYNPDPITSLLIGGKQYHTCEGNPGVPYYKERPYIAQKCDVNTVRPNTKFTLEEARAGLSAEKLKPYDASKYVTLECRPELGRYGASYRTGQLLRSGAQMEGDNGNITLTMTSTTDYESFDDVCTETDDCGTVVLQHTSTYLTTARPAWKLESATPECVCPSDSVCPFDKWVKDVQNGDVTDISSRGLNTIKVRCQKKTE